MEAACFICSRWETEIVNFGSVSGFDKEQITQDFCFTLGIPGSFFAKELQENSTMCFPCLFFLKNVSDAATSFRNASMKFNELKAKLMETIKEGQVESETRETPFTNQFPSDESRRIFNKSKAHYRFREKILKRLVPAKIDLSSVNEPTTFRPTPLSAVSSFRGSTRSNGNVIEKEQAAETSVIPIVGPLRTTKTPSRPSSARSARSTSSKRSLDDSEIIIVSKRKIQKVIQEFKQKRNKISGQSTNLPQKPQVSAAADALVNETSIVASPDEILSVTEEHSTSVVPLAADSTRIEPQEVPTTSVIFFSSAPALATASSPRAPLRNSFTLTQSGNFKLIKITEQATGEVKTIFAKCPEDVEKAMATPGATVKILTPTIALDRKRELKTIARYLKYTKRAKGANKSKPRSKKVIFPCFRCQKKFDNFQKLTDHKEICGVSKIKRPKTPSGQTSKKGKKTREKTIESKKKKRKEKCIYCGKFFFGLITHIRSAHPSGELEHTNIYEDEEEQEGSKD